MDLQSIYSKVRNIFNLAALKSRDGETVIVETSFGRTIEAQELFPYGFFAKATKGKAIVLSQGGNAASFVLLPVCSSDGAPELKGGDSSL